MDDVVAFVQQAGPTVLIVALMVLMHVFGHGAHGHGGRDARHDDAHRDRGAGRADPGSPPGDTRA